MTDRPIPGTQAWSEYWAAVKDAAQAEPRVKLVDGVYDRLPYGREYGKRFRYRATCGDCGVALGQVHVQGCTVERCPRCGDQAACCDCWPEELH